MRYRKLGNTGLIVSEMCLGAMTFGSGEGMWATVAGVSQESVTDLIKAAFDRGINFIDTADFYSNGRSESVTGNALKLLGQPRDSYVLATKVLLRMGTGHNQIGNLVSVEVPRGDPVGHTMCRGWIRHPCLEGSVAVAKGDQDFV